MSDSRNTRPFLTTDELAEELGLNPITLARWRIDGKGRGPSFLKFSRRGVRYSRAAVDQWISQNSQTVAA